MFEDALKYPSRGDDALKNVLIGGGLQILALFIYFAALLLSFVFVGIFLFPFVLVPQVLVYGYLVRVSRYRLDGVAEPPGWSDWTELFVDGLKVFLITLAYSLPVVVIWVGGLILVVGFGYAGGDVGNALSGLTTGVLVLLTLLYSLAMLYVMPVGLVNFAREDRVGAAFDLSLLRDVATNGDYAVPWLLAAVVYLVGGFVGQALILLLFVGFFVVFYVMVSSVYLLTEGYVDATGVERTGRPGPGDAGQQTLDDVAGRGGSGAAGTSEETTPRERRDDETPPRSRRDDAATKGAEVYPAIDREEQEDDGTSSADETTSTDESATGDDEAAGESDGDESPDDDRTSDGSTGGDESPDDDRATTDPTRDDGEPSDGDADDDGEPSDGDADDDAAADGDSEDESRDVTGR